MNYLQILKLQKDNLTCENKILQNLQIHGN